MRGVQTEEGVVFNAGFPQVLARPVAHHVEADQVLKVLVLERLKVRDKGLHHISLNNS